MPSGFEVRRSAQCHQDLTAILDYLFDAYCNLGEEPAEAFDRAANKLRGIESSISQLGDVPFQGTLDSDIMNGLRHVTKQNAVVYFVPDETRQEVRVLAVFFGGQNHRQHILGRIKGTLPKA